MRRLFGRTLLFLLIGAVINVGVSWGCVARLTQLSDGRTYLVASPATLWFVTCSEELGVTSCRWIMQDHAAAWDPPGTMEDIRTKYLRTKPKGLEQGEPPAWSVLADVELPPKWPPSDTAFSELRARTWAGWPCHALTRDEEWINTGATAYPGALVLRRGSGVLALPYRVVYGGFVINTLLYAAAAALGSWGVVHLRSRFREARHLCTACAYPVGTSPVCTECGRPIAVRALEGVTSSKV
jgi:hypothetical protein